MRFTPKIKARNLLFGELGTEYHRESCEGISPRLCECNELKSFTCETLIKLSEKLPELGEVTHNFCAL